MRSKKTKPKPRSGSASLVPRWSRSFWLRWVTRLSLATVAMAAHYATPVLVVIGTTVGMLIADVPAVFVGDRAGREDTHESCALGCGCDLCVARRGDLDGRLVRSWVSDGPMENVYAH